MPADLTVVRWYIRIAGSTTVSDADQDLTGLQLVALQMPTAFTGTAITFQSKPRQARSRPAPTNVTITTLDAYQGVYDAAGVAVSLTVAPSRFITLTGATLDAMLGLGQTKLVSGSAEGADREIIGIAQPIGDI